MGCSCFRTRYPRQPGSCGGGGRSPKRLNAQTFLGKLIKLMPRGFLQAHFCRLWSWHSVFQNAFLRRELQQVVLHTPVADQADVKRLVTNAVQSPPDSIQNPHPLVAEGATAQHRQVYPGAPFRPGGIEHSSQQRGLVGSLKNKLGKCLPKFRRLRNVVADRQCRTVGLAYALAW